VSDDDQQDKNPNNQMRPERRAPRLPMPEVDDRDQILHLLAGIAVHEPDVCVVNGAFQYRS